MRKYGATSPSLRFIFEQVVLKSFVPWGTVSTKCCGTADKKNASGSGTQAGFRYSSGGNFSEKLEVVGSISLNTATVPVDPVK